MCRPHPQTILTVILALRLSKIWSYNSSFLDRCRVHAQKIYNLYKTYMRDKKFQLIRTVIYPTAYIIIDI